jgi:hypothetical protein
MLAVVVELELVAVELVALVAVAMELTAALALLEQQTEVAAAVLVKTGQEQQLEALVVQAL